MERTLIIDTFITNYGKKHMSNIGYGNALNPVNGMVTATDQNIYFSIEARTRGYSSTPAS